MNRPWHLVLTTAVVLGAVSLPARAEPVCYQANADDSDIEFHFEIEGSAFSGRFGSFDVEYCMEPDSPAQGEIDVRIDLASVGTGNRDLDIGVQDREALDVDNYPEATWSTHSIRRDGDRFSISGELTIRGVTREETGYFSLEEEGSGWRLTGSSDIERLDYDVGIGEFEDTDFIPNEVRIEYDFVLREP